MTWLSNYFTTTVHNINVRIDFNIKNNKLKNIMFIEWVNLLSKIMSFKVDYIFVWITDSSRSNEYNY